MILAAAPVTKSHETSARVARVAVRLPMTTLPSTLVLNVKIRQIRENPPKFENICQNLGKWGTNFTVLCVLIAQITIAPNSFMCEVDYP